MTVELTEPDPATERLVDISECPPGWKPEEIAEMRRQRKFPSQDEVFAAVNASEMKSVKRPVQTVPGEHDARHFQQGS